MARPKDGAPKEAGAKPRGARRKALNDRLLAELRRLQDDLHTMSEHFEVRLGAALNDMITRIEGDDTIDQPSRLATLRTVQAMLEVIDSTKLKPHKARAKDFERFERLVRSLSDLQA